MAINATAPADATATPDHASLLHVVVQRSLCAHAQGRSQQRQHKHEATSPHQNLRRARLRLSPMAPVYSLYGFEQTQMRSPTTSSHKPGPISSQPSLSWIAFTQVVPNVEHSWVQELSLRTT